MRILAVLNERNNASADLATLVLLDHALLHSGDFDGPPSLHPPVPMRSAELTVKRDDLQGGLQVLTRAGLVDVDASPSGIQYRAADPAAHFLSLLESDYALELIERAAWVDQTLGHLQATEDLRGALTSALGRWAEEFGGPEGPIDGSTPI